MTTDQKYNLSLLQETLQDHKIGWYRNRISYSHMLIQDDGTLLAQISISDDRVNFNVSALDFFVGWQTHVHESSSFEKAIDISRGYATRFFQQKLMDLAGLNNKNGHRISNAKYVLVEF